MKVLIMLGFLALLSGCAALQGAGRGLQQGAQTQRPMTCFTHNVGAVTQMHCR